MSNLSIPHKFTDLDSLRGIAALMVIFQHMWEMDNISDARLKPWLFFCAGHEAVILFFVLSGFALTHQLRNFSISEYPKFVVRRFLRIYPVYYVALSFSAISLYVISKYIPNVLAEHNLTKWFYIWSSTSFDKELFISSFTLISHQGNSLIVAVWSLFYEMWISLIFPIILFLLWRSKIFISGLSIVTLFVVSYCLWKQGQFIDNQWQSIIYYLWYFILGATLYYIHDKVYNFANMWVLFIGLAFYFSNYILFGLIHDRMIHEIIVALGSFIILLNGIHNDVFKNILRSPILKFYGKISYSLYLFHLPVLYVLSYTILRNHDILLVKLLLIPVATLFAWGGFHLCEQPFINVARKYLK
ncbi:MAG: acyltransferase [Burkholderiales bacterium]|nr:acyltransferase [Burkholderiales bacterium]